MSFSDRRAFLLGAAGFALAGCGFSPLYGEGEPAREVLGRVDVGLIEGEPGFEMRRRLVERLGYPESPTHRLEVDLELRRAGVALTDENVTTRFNIVGEADYVLVPLNGGDPVRFDSVISTTGFSAPDSSTSVAFAVQSAQRDAERRVAVTLADQIALRLAVSAGEWGV